jgi:UDP-glucose 4-epimerase
MPRCLITGGAGFIGSHLTEQLLQAGHDVVVLDDLSTGRRDNLQHVESHPRLTVRVGSITDPVLLADAARGVDRIYHLAAAVAVQGQQKFFLASTSEVYGKNAKEVWTEEDDLHLGPTSRPRWAYGCSKAIDEFLALAYHRKFGLEVVVGRFFNVVGPRQVGHYGMVVPRFVDQALAGGPVVVYDDGSQVRCFAHVREVVDCIARLMETPAAAGKVCNIGSDQPVSIRQLAEAVIARVDPQVKIQYIPYTEAYGADFEDVQRRVPDVSRLASLLGTKPSLTLGEILDDIIRHKRGT